MNSPDREPVLNGWWPERADIVKVTSLPEHERIDHNGQSFARDKQVVLLRTAEAEYPRAYLRLDAEAT